MFNRNIEIATKEKQVIRIFLRLLVPPVSVIMILLLTLQNSFTYNKMKRRSLGTAPQ